MQSQVEVIKSLLLEYYLKGQEEKKLGVVITLEGEHLYTLHLNKEGEVMVDKVSDNMPGPSVRLLEMSSENIYDIYRFLEANKYNPDMVTELEVILPEWEKLSWKNPPVEIKTGDDLVARLGVVSYSETEWAVVLVSSDRTWTVLTVWEKDNADAAYLAERDIVNIGRAISTFTL